MNDPDVIAGVHRHANGLTLIPAVRQRLRPHRIDFEPRRLRRAVGLSGERFLERALGCAEREQRCDQRRSDECVSFHH